MSILSLAGIGTNTRTWRNAFCAAKAGIGTYTICVRGECGIYPTLAERLCAAKARICTYTICVCGECGIYPTTAERLCAAKAGIDAYTFCACEDGRFYLSEYSACSEIVSNLNY